jgi:hypothetical protein
MSTAAIVSNVHTTAAPKTQSAAAPAKSPSAPPAARSSASVASAVVTASAAALKEVTETGAQTAKEASSGDRQAQRLLAKEAAARSGGVSRSSQAISGKGGRLNVKA